MGFYEVEHNYSDRYSIIGFIAYGTKTIHCRCR